MFSIACILLASLCVVDSSTMRCSANATFNFVEDETPNITCIRLPKGQGIYWSVTGPSTGRQETLIGDCLKCGFGGACSCITHSTDYNITRNGDTSTLFFVDNLSGNNRSTITCSSEKNNTCVTSTINIIKAPVRCQHADNCIEIEEDQPTPITCQGAPGKDIYWSVTRPSTHENRIGNCSKCATTNHLPCTCDTHNGDYSITRTGDQTTAVSILQFVNNVSSNDNSTIKCSTSDDNQPLVFVSIKVIPDPGALEHIYVVVDSSLQVTGRAEFVSSGDNVSCFWFYSSDNSTKEEVQVTATHLNLSTFTVIHGREYQRGTCNMTMQLNASEMTHYFRVEIQPGDGPQFAESVTIRKPGTTLTTTCPDYVSEGSDLTCECSHLTAQHGNPPATISWRDVTDTADLHVTNVLRNQSGTQYVCTSVWGAGPKEEVRSTLIYTLLVVDDDPEPFPWVVVGVAVGATVLVIAIVIAIVAVVARRRASKTKAEEHSAEANSADDEFEEHINDLYQSSDLDTPPPPNQSTPASAQQAFHLQPLQASSAPRVSNSESCDTNGIQEMTKSARPDDVYNVLGSTPGRDQKAGAVYNHLTKF